MLRGSPVFALQNKNALQGGTDKVAAEVVIATTDPPPGQKDGIPSDVRKMLLGPDMVGPLALLLSLGGYSSAFTADAARSILVTNAYQAADAGYGPYLDDRRLEIIVDNARRFVRGQPLRNVVDKAVWY